MMHGPTNIKRKMDVDKLDQRVSHKTTQNFASMNATISNCYILYVLLTVTPCIIL